MVAKSVGVSVTKDTFLCLNTSGMMYFSTDVGAVLDTMAVVEVTAVLRCVWASRYCGPNSVDRLVAAGKITSVTGLFKTVVDRLVEAAGRSDSCRLCD